MTGSHMGRRQVLAGMGALAGLSAASSAGAQTYPSEPVRILVPVPAGGVTDLLARLVGQGLSELWGQSVVIENKPGGNYGVGSQVVARAKPDGHTLLVTADSTFTANPFLFSKLIYKTEEFEPISLLSRATPMFVVNADIPAKTVAEYIAYVKSRPGGLNYGSYGLGTYAHLGMEDFKARTGTNIVHVPYSGAAPALEGLLRGDISVLLLNLSSIEQHEQSGKLRILASAGAKRASAKPDFPTVDEAGVKGFETSAWFGMFGPAAMPKAIIEKINTDVQRVLQSPKIQDLFRKNSFETELLTPNGMRQLVERDSRYWSNIINTVGIKLD